MTIIRVSEVTVISFLKYLAGYLQRYVRTRLWLQVLVGMVLGITLGILIGPTVGWIDPATATIISDWVAFPGKLFLALIQMVVIPLVFASIIRGLASTEDIEQLRKIGIRAVLYFIATTAVAITIGLTVASIVKPGVFVDATHLQADMAAISMEADAEASSKMIQFNELPQ